MMSKSLKARSKRAQALRNGGKLPSVKPGRVAVAMGRNPNGQFKVNGEPRTVNVSFRTTESISSALDEAVERTGSTKTAILEEALEFYLNGKIRLP